MKKILIIATLLLSLTIASNAQSTTTPLQVDDKDVYVLSRYNSDIAIVGSIRLTEEQIISAKDINDRVLIAIKSTKQNFDAVLTRDGRSFQLLKYNSNNAKVTGNVMQFAKKEVYFLSTPTKKYKIIDTKKIGENDLKKSFYQIATIYTKDKAIVFDAIIVVKDEVKYIIFEK